MSTITKERVTNLLQFNSEGGDYQANAEQWEVHELARIALASLEAGKVVLYRERNPYNGLTTGWQELTEDEYEFIKNNAGENAEFRTVYTASPAPMLPEEMPKGLAGQIVSLLAHNIGDKLLAQKIWNACRAAMLQGVK